MPPVLQRIDELHLILSHDGVYQVPHQVPQFSAQYYMQLIEMDSSKQLLHILEGRDSSLLLFHSQPELS